MDSWEETLKLDEIGVDKTEEIGNPDRRCAGKDAGESPSAGRGVWLSVCAKDGASLCVCLGLASAFSLWERLFPVEPPGTVPARSG